MRKRKLSDEGSELSDKIGQLKLPAADGKNYLTDVLSTKNILCLIQSIPSPKAEPFKMWLAQVGNDRLEEYAAPEKAVSSLNAKDKAALEVSRMIEEK